MIWHLIWRIDKWAHLAGAFMLTTVAMRIPVPLQGWDTTCVVIIMVAGSIGLELWQNIFKPEYPTKDLDTILDLIADSVGITLAVML